MVASSTTGEAETGPLRALFDRTGKLTFETAMLTRPEKLAVLTDLPGSWIQAAHDRGRPSR